MPEISVPMARALVRRTLRPFLHPRVPVSVQRLHVDALGSIAPLPPGTHVLRRAPGGVPARRVAVGPEAAERTILYLHGGAYVVGSSRSHLAWAAHLARAARAVVYVLDYRRAPEHPYPAALDDAHAAWRALDRDTPAGRPLVIAGDSAGGGLALTVALDLAIAEDSDYAPARRPDALVMVSPWLDPLRPWPYDTLLDRDPVLHTSWLTSCAESYAAGTDRDTLAPGVHADLSTLPPTIVQNGTDDVLAPEGAAFVARARAAGVHVEHVEYPDLWHNFQVMAGSLAAADAAVRDLGKSLDTALKG